MSSIHLAEFVLWKSIKQKREEETRESLFSLSDIYHEKMVNPNEMICRVCTSPADIPITNTINGINILSAIRIVSCIWINICVKILKTFHRRQSFAQDPFSVKALYSSSVVQVSNADTYPKYICKHCLEELKVALTFKKKCESSDYLFRQIQLEKPSDNNSLVMVKHDFALIIQQMKERRLARGKATGERTYSRKKTNASDLNTEISEIEKEESPFKVRKCRRCDLTFDTKKLLIQHRLQQNCISPPCPLCGKVVSNLARHNKIVHLRTEKYTCHICGKITYSAGGLRNHLLVHSDKCDFCCPLCPYKGKQQAYLTLHMRIHTGERPYLCSECPAKFVNPSNLRKHQLIHSSKKFECNKCKKQFRLMKTLKEHYEAAHLNVRYRCSICGRDLWTRRKLLSHELRVHNREKHKLYDEVFKVVLNDEKH